MVLGPLMEWPARYVGLPYAERGRCLELDGGLDCWGLYRRVIFDELGVLLPAWDGVDGRDLALCDEVIRADTSQVWVRVDAAQPFDLVVMRGIFRGTDARLHSGEIHCGCMAPGNRVLHVERGHDTVCIPYDRVAKRVTGIFRHRQA